MELVKVLVTSWPFVGLILGFTALCLFRKPLLQLLNRADEVGVVGLKVSAKAQEQRHLDAPPQISRVEELAKVFQSPLLTEVEDQLRSSLDAFSKSPEEREKALLKFLALNQIVVAFERTYFSIFGSQLKALQFLGSSPSLLEDPHSLQPFYDQAKSKNPDFYGSYSFERWLAFLQSQVLITEQDQKVGITVRGREFLKYLIDQGYTFEKAG
jgi:hypothetical protein